MDPVADLAPAKAKELCDVNHEYRLNGKPFTFTTKNYWNRNHIVEFSIIIWVKKLTLVIGFKLCILLHLGRVFPFAGHVWHVRPTSHVPQVSPICYLVLGQKKTKTKKKLLSNIRN